MSDKTVTVTRSTADVPYDVPLDRFILYANPNDGDAYVGTWGLEGKHRIKESYADVIRKLHELHCNEPPDETVGQIGQTLIDVDPQNTFGAHVRIYRGGAREIRHLPQDRSIQVVGTGATVSAAIRSLAKPEPTMQEVFTELRAELRSLFDLGNPTWDAKQSRIHELIAQAEKLEADKCK